MALVKMVRDFPEVPGGKTTADIPEEAVHLAMDNGWHIAEKSAKEDKKDESKNEAKSAEVNADKANAPKADEPKTDDSKADKAKTSKRD